MERLKELTIDLAKFGCEIKLNESMKKHTTFRIGGNADLFIIPRDIDSFIKTIRLLDDLEIPYVILGNGSNMLFDDIYDGIVVSTKGLREYKIDDNLIEVGAGMKINEVATIALENSLSGMERLFGIPGTIGGAVNMNAGSFGMEIGELVESVLVLHDGRVIRLGKKDLKFSYRYSNIFENKMKILSVSLKLMKGNYLGIKYDMIRYMNIRVEKQPIDFPSAGSFFKRPKPDVPVGKLIEESGLKGYRIGNAMVSRKHAAFIVNLGSASSKDVLHLANYVKDKVKMLKGFDLKMEVIHVV